MAKCTVCGNDDDRAFDVLMPDGTSGTYDSIECAVHNVAPRCPHCGCPVLGHGVRVDDAVFCCRHCAEITVTNGAAASVRATQTWC